MYMYTCTVWKYMSHMIFTAGRVAWATIYIFIFIYAILEEDIKKSLINDKTQQKIRFIFYFGTTYTNIKEELHPMIC